MILVMKLDPDGLTRAWGLANTQARAEEEAAAQLEAYRAAKRALGDTLADAEFTTETAEV
jgi:hypothetical protein